MLHPVRGDALTEVEGFLWRFRMVANEAQVLLRGFHNTPDVARDINTDLLFGLCNQGTLIVVKFLEVWDPFGSLVKVDDRVRISRTIAQPLVDRIRIWKGLEQFRSSAVAHPFQLKNGELVGPWDLLAAGKAPTFHAEVILLLTLTERAVLAVLAVFAEDYLALHPLLQSPHPAPDPAPGISLGTEIQPEQERVLAEVNALLVRYNVKVPASLTEEFRTARTRPSR